MNTQSLKQRSLLRQKAETEVATEMVQDKPVANIEVAEPETSAWLDGSEPEIDEEQSGRKLSKAQRKRLRKQKQRRAA